MFIIENSENIEKFYIRKQNIDTLKKYFHFCPLKKSKQNFTKYSPTHFLILPYIVIILLYRQI